MLTAVNTSIEYNYHKANDTERETKEDFRYQVNKI